MPPRRLIQHLLRPGDEALPQPSTIQNQPPTQNLPGIAEGREHAIFTDIEKVELQHATNINTSAIVIGSSQNSGSVDSTQTNGGVLHQSPPRASSPIQVIQEHCHTPFRERGNEAYIRVPRMFKSHAWQQYD
jgi:hypothetical protein